MSIEKPRYTKSDRDEIIETKAPEPTDEQISEPFAHEVLVIVHTVTDDEYWAAVDRMEPPDGCSRCIEYKREAALGTFGGYKAALVQTGRGQACHDEMERALANFPNAQFVVAVGVAYASSKKCWFADVLVSTHIVSLEFTKDNDILTCGEKVKINRELSNTFCKKTDVWAVKKLFSRTESDSSEKSYPQVHTGIIFSAPQSIDNTEIKDNLFNKSPEAVGGEMEAGVLLRLQSKLSGQSPSRRIGVIVIKGVADDGTEGKQWQLTAAMAAVRFASFQLERNGLQCGKMVVVVCGMVKRLFGKIFIHLNVM